MVTLKCICGKSSKTFNKKIGDFYVDECCEAAGYDHMGVLVEAVPPEPNPEKPEKNFAEELQESLDEGLKVAKGEKAPKKRRKRKSKKSNGKQ